MKKPKLKAMKDDQRNKNLKRGCDQKVHMST